MAPIKRLMTVDQWEEALKSSNDKPLLVFKHSTSCPISAGARDELDNYMKDLSDSPVDFAIVHVIEERPVSNTIAEELGIQHKSPQAILVKDGKPSWDESHWRITADFLRDKISSSEA